MSHTVSIKTVLRDVNAIDAACLEMGLQQSERGSVRFHDGATHNGVVVKLPGWKYPAVITDAGEVKFDNYNGTWGDIKHLNRLTQCYGVCRAELEAKKKNLVSKRFNLPDGTIRLTINVGKRF